MSKKSHFTPKIVAKLFKYDLHYSSKLSFHNFVSMLTPLSYKLAHTGDCKRKMFSLKQMPSNSKMYKKN